MQNLPTVGVCDIVGIIDTEILNWIDDIRMYFLFRISDRAKAPFWILPKRFNIK